MPDTSTLEITVAAKSDTGLKREENQDRMSRFYSPFGEVFLVADGMGGHRGGARAASMVSDGFARHLKALTPATPVELAIRMAAEKTNGEIVAESRSDHAETAGMGATLVLAILRGNDAVIAHVGDSRAYLFRNGNLQPLTRDHTRGQDKVNAGFLSEDEAWDNPESSVLTRAFGHSNPLTIDISAPISLQTGDQILLCSDGLCGYIRDSAIAEVLSRGFGAKRTAEKLVQLANEAGGEDNVTVQMILVGDQPHDREPEPTEIERATRGDFEPAAARQRKTSAKVIALALATAFLAAAAWGGYTLLLQRTKSHLGPASGPRASDSKTKVASTIAKPELTLGGTNGGPAPVIFVFGDKSDEIRKFLKTKLKADAKDLPTQAQRAFAPVRVGVLVDTRGNNPPVEWAYKIHEAVREFAKGENGRSRELVALLPMDEKERNSAVDGRVVVVFNDVAAPVGTKTKAKMQHTNASEKSNAPSPPSPGANQATTPTQK